MIKRIVPVCFLVVTSVFLSLWGANALVEKSSRDNIYHSTENIPYNKVGLLLGTGKILRNGRINFYYKYRIEAAVALYKAGKVEYILVSGDNSRKDYDEPTSIKDDLIQKGIPAQKIILDYAGFRTLDSAVRCKAIFGQEKITVISQQFHNERAIYIAKHNDIEAIGFNAKDVGQRFGFKTMVRERFARVKMILDLLIGKQPKFLGEKIIIE